MRFWHLWVLVVLLMSTGCSSYEEEQKVEAALTQSLNSFHEQLNNEQFHDIYIEADPSLRQHIDETAFTNQVKNAHDQLGKISPQKRVLLSSHAWNDLQWSRFFGRKEIVLIVEFPNSDLINGSERIEWSVENNQPKLVSYEFRFICRKPCIVGIGP